jgi:hypothetical protein
VDELLERDGELSSVEALLDEAVAGEGRVILFEGPAGIGKTRLLGEARRQDFELHPIGRVESPLGNLAAAPRQGDEGAPEAWLAIAPGPVLSGRVEER